MKRWLLILGLVLTIIIPTPISAQTDDECSPDLTQVNILLIEAQQALNNDDTETALQKMTEANELLTAEIEACQPNDETGDEFVFFDPENIDDLLLTIDDFPSGWSLEPFEEEEGDSTFLCSELPDVENGSKAEVRFSSNRLGPLLQQLVGGFETVEAAEERFQAMQLVVESCDTWTVTDEEGEDVVYTLVPLSASEFGDQSMAVRLTFDNIQADAIYVRAANVLLVIVQFTTNLGDPIDPDLTESLIELTLNRME